MPTKHPAPSPALRALQQHPALPELIPQLEPRLLARLFQALGVADSGSLMAAAPPALLARALDEALWTEHAHGSRFEPEAFLGWLEVWLDQGERFCAERLAALEEDTLAVCFAAALRVDDVGTAGFASLPEDPDSEVLEEPEGERFGEYRVSARFGDEWDLLRTALVALWDHEPQCLDVLLRRLTVPGLHPDSLRARLEHDAAATREARRERRGFVPAATARAFLGLARHLSVDALLEMPAYDPATARQLARFDVPAHAAAAPTPTPEQPAAPTPDQPALWSLLTRAGVVEVTPDPEALLPWPDAGPRPCLEQHLHRLARDRPDHHQRCATELAYLANVLLADPDGKEGSLSGADARALAFATCNLGLELLDRSGRTPGLECPPGLIRPFLLARRALDGLPDQVASAFQRAAATPAATRTLAGRAWLARHTAESLDDLRLAVEARRFGEAREALALLSLAFHTDTCRAAAHLLAHHPAFPLWLDRGDTSGWRWISRAAELEQVAALLAGIAPKTRVSPLPAG